MAESQNVNPSENQIDQLIADYLDGTLNKAHRASFEAWLKASPEHPRRVARLSATDYAIREVCQDTKADYLIDVLNQIEDASVPARIVNLSEQQEPEHEKQTQPMPAPLSAGEIAGISGYLFRQALTSKPALLAYAAAITLTTVALLLPWGTTSNPTDNTPAASSTPTPHGSDTDSNFPQPVATLTATHNAVWASKPAGDLRRGDALDLRRGDPLTANQRLTLTQGFAEITTARGAIAILEAPATIELLDNGNALRLHSGKIVGICETESSKGFLVRTPHMDITDLGTRFGIDVHEAGRSEVQVFDGEVEVTTAGARPGTPAKRLTSGQAASASVHNNAIAPLSYQPAGFAKMIERSYQSPDYVLAYWRFEEGVPGDKVPNISGNQADYSTHAASDASGHGNRLYAFAATTSPAFTDTVPASFIPQTGQLNRVAIDDTAVPRRSPINLYTRSPESRPTLSIEDAPLTHWTIEASIKPATLEGKQAIVCRYLRTLLDDGNALLLGLDEGKLFISLKDATGQDIRVIADEPITSTQWTHVAAIYDGQTLYLYANSQPHVGYTLLAQAPVDASIRPDADPSSQWAWSLGGAKDSLDARALIDEVRISDKALAVRELLFSKPGLSTP